MAVAARATAVFGLVFGLAATASALAPALDQPVQGGAPAERGSQESLVTAKYPTGPCDLIGGTLAMARDQHPTSVEQIGESVLGRPIQAEHWGPATTVATMHPGWADTPGVADSLPLFRTLTGPLLRDVVNTSSLAGMVMVLLTTRSSMRDSD